MLPITSKTGWKLKTFYHGIKVWSHNVTVLSQKYLMYGCQAVVVATPQEVLQTFQDVSNLQEWDLYTEYSRTVCSPCSSDGSVESTDVNNQQQNILYFDTVSYVPKYNTTSHQVRKFVVKLSNYIPGITVVEHENLSVNIVRCWQTEYDDSVWMFSECPDTNVQGICWTYFEARPLQDGLGSLLTIVACPDLKESLQSEMIATQLASLKDYFQLMKVKMQPSQEDNIGNKLKAFAGQLKKKAQTFSFKKDQFQLDSADTQAIQNQLKATDEQMKAVEREKKAQKEKKIEKEPRKFGKRLSFDFYKNKTVEKPTSKSMENARDSDSISQSSSMMSSMGSSNSSINSTAFEETKQIGTREDTRENYPPRTIDSEKEDTKKTLKMKLKDLARTDSFGKLQEKKTDFDDSRNIHNGSSVVRRSSSTSSSAESTGQNTPTKLANNNPIPITANSEMKIYRTLANQAAAEVLAEALKAASIDVSSSDAEQRKQTGGWQFQCLEKEVVILRKVTDSSRYHSFLGKGLIKAPPKAVYEAVKNPLTRFTYDNMLKKLDVVANLGTGLQILHLIHEITQIFRKDCRDFAVLQTSRIDGDLYIVAMTSIDWPECHTSEGVIRASINPSGWVIEPAFRNRKVQSMVTYMVQIDIGGKDVPASFFNFLSKRIPLSIAYLRQYLQSGLP
ncbi:stAR-related lipid transfer protein 9-like isoform X2 [Ptychodera flava]